jgi:hypothetical protein
MSPTQGSPTKGSPTRQVKLGGPPVVSWRTLESGQALARLAAVLAPWEGTPYAPGQQCRGVGVDCVRFVIAVLDELTGKQTAIRTLPPDSSVHNPAAARERMELISQAYAPYLEVTDGVVEPGDILVTGPLHGGPGHVMIVGNQRNVLWHATAPRVQKTGFRAFHFFGHRVFHVRRLADRNWA